MHSEKQRIPKKHGRGDGAGQEAPLSSSRNQTISRRHHVLPRSYLEHWIDPASVALNRTPVVWRIARDGLRVAHHNPGAQIFWQLDANNTVREDGTLDDGIERLLARVEHVVAEATRGPIACKEPLDRDASDALNMFFSAMVFRAPSMRASLVSMFEAFAQMERATCLAGGRPVPADNAALTRNGPPNATADALFAVLDVLERMTHMLLVAPPSECFVTSDRPAIIHAEAGPRGLANSLCEASLPLSPQVMLLMSWNGFENSCYCPTETDVVLEMNRRTVAYSDKWFVCNRRDFDRRWIPANAVQSSSANGRS